MPHLQQNFTQKDLNMLKSPNAVNWLILSQSAYTYRIYIYNTETALWWTKKNNSFKPLACIVAKDVV